MGNTWVLHVTLLQLRYKGRGNSSVLLNVILEIFLQIGRIAENGCKSTGRIVTREIVFVKKYKWFK